jgi:DNA invertase Pin-like site-specific DNA recombinase
MVELFERHAVSFVSVTQAFSTTTSMGRLTLNVLLSFAQFEREVTGERIRDKIAASKKKGLWMGGTIPLGYDLPDPGLRVLRINAPEAVLVRSIFERYLQLGSVHALERDLAARGVRTKQTPRKDGTIRGGIAFSRGALFHLLRNRLGKARLLTATERNRRGKPRHSRGLSHRPTN